MTERSCRFDPGPGHYDKITMSISVLRRKLEDFVGSSLFQNTTLGLIITYAILVGIRLYYPNIYLLSILDSVIIWFFVVEVSLRVIAFRHIYRFFIDGWNVFDFIVTFSTFIPGVGSMAAVSRVLRVFRVLRLVTFSRELRLIVGTLMKSFSSMAYVAVLLSIVFYIYGVLGTVFFANISPQHFGALHKTILTLFKIVTLEGWLEIMESVASLGSLVYLYFISFIVLGTFVILNLFIAIIVNNLDTIKKEDADKTL